MNSDQRENYLKIALRIIGAFFVLGIYPMMMWISPAGWGWEPRQPEYEYMIIGIFATLGVFLFRAAQNPKGHLSLIWFTIWSSAVHGVIMLIEALADRNEHANMIGDIPALFLVSAILWYLLPKQQNI